MTGKPEDFQQALAAFEDLEHRLGLPHWSVNGVYVWKLLRFSMFSQYRQHLGQRHTVHPEKNRLKKSKIQIFGSFAKSLIFRNPFFISGCEVERIVVPHTRKLCYDGRFIEPISYPAWRPPYEKKTTILDNTDVLNPIPLLGAPSFEVLLRLAWIRGKAVCTRLESKDLQIVSNLSRELFQENTRSELEAYIKKSLKSFVGLKQVFSSFLEKTQPKYLYIVGSYGLEALIAAAQDFGIEVIEFQHGSLGRGHLGYDFKGWGNVPYFPDRMLAFGTDWFREAYFPEACVIDPVGYGPMEGAIAVANEEITRNRQQVLVLSQGPLADQIIEHAAEFCARRQDWRAVIRPHPSENADHLRQHMAGMAKSDNWRVEGAPSLQEHTAASSVVVGVNSTALIEALLAGCRVALLDIVNSPGYFDSLARDGHAMKIKSGAELAELIDTLPDGSGRGYFAHPVNDIVIHVEGRVS